MHTSSSSFDSSSSFEVGPDAVTLAGTGAPGFAGDGGIATSAELDAPEAIAEDRRGDLFIADTGNCRVREVPAASGTRYGIRMIRGTLYTIAGGPCGATPGSRSAARTGRVGFVTALTVDSSGDVFLAGGTGNVVYELPSRSGIQFGTYMTSGRLSVVAGDGAAGDEGDGRPAVDAELNVPSGVGVDPAGDLFIADTEIAEIREVASHDGPQWGITMLQGRIYTVAGTGGCGEAGDGGPAGEAELWNPVDVVVGPVGDLLISDSGGEEIVDLPPVSGTYYGIHIAADHLGVVAGTGSYGPYVIDGLSATAETAELNSAAEIALDGAGDLFIADPYSSSVREVPSHDVTQRGRPLTVGDMYTVAGALTGDLGDTTMWFGAQMLYPFGVAVAPNGGIVYSDQGANVVREIPAS